MRPQNLTPTSDSKSTEIQKKPIYLLSESKTNAQKAFYGLVHENNTSHAIYLDLRNQSLGDKDSKELSLLIATRFSEIKVLDLSDNYFSTRSLKNFLKKLQKINIKEIRMEKTNIDIKAINYLISFMKYNKSLKKFLFVNVDRTKISSSYMEKISTLKKKGLSIRFTNV